VFTVATAAMAQSGGAQTSPLPLPPGVEKELAQKPPT